jgi:hypothetical protein
VSTVTSAKTARAVKKGALRLPRFTPAGIALGCLTQPRLLKQPKGAFDMQRACRATKVGISSEGLPVVQLYSAAGKSSWLVAKALTGKRSRRVVQKLLRRSPN